jgi:hypothetical protein
MRQRKVFRAALALVLVLCLGSFTAAFAEGDPVEGTETSPAQAGITKILRMPEGTAAPAASFTFEVAKVSLEGLADTAALATMPAISDVTINLSGVTPSTSGNVTTLIKESANIFSGTYMSKAFDHAGIYKYKITEKNNTYTDSNPGDGITETMSYSDMEYTITLWVEKGTGSNYYIKVIASSYVEDDGQNPPTDEKVDPTPGGGGSYDYSQMIFENGYMTTKDVVNPTTGSTLYVNAAVGGGFANEETYFPYSVTLTVPAFLEKQTYRGYVVDATNTVVTSADNGAVQPDAGDTLGAYIDFASGSAVTVNLKAGQKLVFIDTPAGAAWTATDTLSTTADPFKDYLAGVTYTDNNGSPQTITNTDPDTQKGVALTVPASGTLLVNIAGSYAQFTNTRNVTSPTGILLNNLPYIGLILLAVAALVLFVVFKSRKRKQES